jgi:GNAT superfamily N-acetyltransferase
LVESVRPFAGGDTAVVASLESEARVAAAQFKGGAAWLAEEPAVGEWGSLPADEGALVACIDGHVVGYLHHRRVHSTLIVRSVWVEPEARELGLGDELLAAAVAHGIAAGCTTIEGSALPGDRLTKNLYERAGITARKITVSRSLIATHASAVPSS